MPKKMAHSAFFFLALTALTGIWMRFFPFLDEAQALPYDHLLHGHSHAAVLGWTFLAALLLYFHLTWEHLQHNKQAIALTIATFIITTAMFIAFLWQGYALYSIIFSSVHILIEYWAIIFVFRSLRQIENVPVIARRFIQGGLIALFISSIGPWSLGAIASQGLQQSPLFEMAIYFYLHFQYNGWLYFMLVGLFLYLLHQKGISISDRRLKASFVIYAIALIPAYALSVLWYDFGTSGIIFAAIGALGQLIGAGLLILALAQKRTSIGEHFGKRVRLLLTFVFSLLLLKSLTELGLLHLPFAALIYETRSVVVGYLHLTFLGFISLLALSMFQMVRILDGTNRLMKTGMTLFITGFTLNELVLFSSGLLSWTGLGAFPLQNGLLLMASLLLACGICFIWSDVFITKHAKRIEDIKEMKKAT